MISRERIKRWTIRLAIVFGVFALLLCSLNIYLASRIKATLIEKVAEVGHGLYTLRIGDSHAGILRGNIELDNVQLVPDSMLYKKLTAAGLAPGMMVTLTIPSVKISGLHPLQAWKGNKLLLAGIDIEDPKIIILHRENDKKNKEQDDKDIYNMIKKRFSEAKANRISINNASLLYMRQRHDTTAEHLVMNVSLSWNDVVINESSVNDTSRCLYSKNFTFDATGYSWSLQDSLYTITASAISLSSAKHELVIDSLKVKPNYSKPVFPTVKGAGSTRVAAVINKIELLGVNIKELLEKKYVSAHLLHVANGYLDVYKDKRYSHHGKRWKPMPQYALRHAGISLSIDSVRLDDISVDFDQVTNEGLGPGKISFQHIYASTDKLSNSKEFLAAKPVCTMHAKANIMGNASTALVLTFQLADSNNTFTCKGKMSDMDLPALNAMVQNTGVMKFNRGKVDRLDFTAVFTEQSSHGIMYLAYHDLGAELLDKRSGKQGAKEKLLSFISRYKVPESNPEDPDEPLREGKIDYIRDTDKSVFGYFWKSLQTGIFSTMKLEGMAEKVKMESLAKK
jgi:hypothetical protein